MRFPINILFRLPALLLLVGASSASAEEPGDLLQRVEFSLEPRLQAPTATPIDESKLDSILARPDPGTFFLRYAFGLKQNADKLLSGDQRERLFTVLDRHTPANMRWHDERNTLRCKWIEVMWRYVAANDAEALRLHAQLDRWMRLRMIWTEQEHLAQYRFARDTWNVLTPEQQRRLLAGEWKEFAKQDTGHTRGDFTEKTILRALGEPDDEAAFHSAVTAWSKRRTAFHAALSDAENNERRIVFAMDLNSEPLAHAASLKANAAYSALYTAEAEAVRLIVKAAYHNPSARCSEAAADAWNEAPKRFAAGASELLKLLGRP